MVQFRSRTLAITALAVVATASLGSAALAQSPSAGESPAGSPAASMAASMAPIVPISGSVVVIPKQVNNPYFDVAFKGAQNAAAVYGGDVTQVGPTAADATQQIPFIQTAITQGAKAILISADDATAVAPALQQAMAAGIKVVGYDSSPAPGAYNVFVNQADTAGIGKGLAQMACDLAPSCTGEIAVLSAAQTATNQNAWIDAMKTTLTDPTFANLKLVDVVYGNDDPTVSTQQAQALITAHPDLKVIVAPTTVGIVAAAQVVEAQNLVGQVAVTGLGTPKGMQSYVKSGSAPEFALWNVTDLGYLAYATAADLVNGVITGAPGETYSVGTLNGGQPYTIGADSSVVLGPPFVFNADNIDQYVTEFGF
jgi:rhamnose transport system substrate-binding protein